MRPAPARRSRGAYRPAAPEDEHRHDHEEREPVLLGVPRHSPQDRPVAVVQLAEDEREVERAGEAERSIRTSAVTLNVAAHERARVDPGRKKGAERMSDAGSSARRHRRPTRCRLEASSPRAFIVAPGPLRLRFTARRPSTRKRRVERGAPARVEQVVVVEVRVHVGRQRTEHGARERSERMRRREDAVAGLAAPWRAVDEAELRDGGAHSVVRVPAAAAEVARLEAARAHPLRLAPDARGRIAAGRARVRRARPVRVQPEGRACGGCAGTLEPRLFPLSVIASSGGRMSAITSNPPGRLRCRRSNRSQAASSSGRSTWQDTPRLSADGEGTLLSPMCGICGLYSPSGAAVSGPRRRDACAHPASRPRPGLDGRVRHVRPRPPAAAGDRSRARLSAGRQRARRRGRSLQRRALQLPGAAARARGEGATRSADAATRRSSRICTRSSGRRSPSGSRACSRSPCGTPRSSDSCSRATGSGRSRSSGRASRTGRWRSRPR